MAFKNYVALATVEHKDEDGNRVFAKPASAKHNGVFRADFTETTEARLLERRAIRLATKRDLADETPVEVEEGGADDNDDGLDALKVDALRGVAEAENIDLGTAKKASDMVAVIRKARAAAPEDFT